MAVERVERQGWFSRLRSAVFGILIGILLVGGAGILQFWNEGRTLRQHQMLESGRAEVVSIPTTSAAEYSGRLVHVSDELEAEGERIDPDFNQIAEGLGLRRKVEMYQWRERSEKREETSVGGTKTTRRTYSYKLDWDDEIIDSSEFEEPEGHTNPTSMPFPAEEWRAEQVRLGQVQLSGEVINEVGGWKAMAVQAERLPANMAAAFRTDDGVLTTTDGEPQAGDLRISFSRLPEGPLSVVGRLSVNTLQADQRAQGRLLLVERGHVPAERMFDNEESLNAGIGWLLRFVGFALMWAGFGLMLAPLSVFADVVPMFGHITRWISTLIGGVLAALISFVAIASGWLYNRPWLLGLLLIAAAAGVGWLVLRGRRGGPELSSEQPVPPPSGPPPPPPGFDR
jgi:hypothetical protein